jgi:hypothetical protein
LPSFIWIDRGRPLRACAGIAALSIVALSAFDGEAASCLRYPREIRAAIKKHVEALRAVEREAADRLKGLDTRPFAYLVERALAANDVIADKNALKEEEQLSQCSPAIAPIRRVCAQAAQALTDLLKQQAGGGSKASTRAYAQTMPQCERGMELAPLSTVFRGTD